MVICEYYLRIELKRKLCKEQWARIKAGLTPRNGEHFHDEQWWSRTQWSSLAVIGWQSAHLKLSTTVIKWYEPPKCTKVREARGWWPFRRGSSGRVFSWVTPRRHHSSIGTYLLFLFHQNHNESDERMNYYQFIVYNWTAKWNHSVTSDIPSEPLYLRQETLLVKYNWKINFRVVLNCHF